MLALHSRNSPSSKSSAGDADLHAGYEPQSTRRHVFSNQTQQVLELI